MEKGQVMQKRKLAVIFQGIGYNADKPLLYYSKKIKLLIAVVAMVAVFCPVCCYADTMAVPYGSSNVITQTIPGSGGSYSRTDIIYSPGAGTSYEDLYNNGFTGDSLIDINGTGYTQITTSYGNTGMATVTVTPVYPDAVPSDTDAYQMAYLSALQSYGLTIDPVTGQVVSINKTAQ